MSDNVGDRFGDAGFTQVDLDELVPHAGSINPDFTGSLYAPVRYTPPTNPMASINPNSYTGDDAAQRLSADVIRAQFKDYQTRFQPLEDMAIGLITPTGTKDGPLDVARSKATISGAYDNMQGQQNRAMERFGLQGAGNNIEGSNSETSALVGGINSAKLADQDRRLKILGGGSSAVAAATGGG